MMFSYQIFTYIYSTKHIQSHIDVYKKCKHKIRLSIRRRRIYKCVMKTAEQRDVMTLDRTTHRMLEKHFRQRGNK